jgi:glycosyl hydrolase group 75 (putative chitosanase)
MMRKLLLLAATLLAVGSFIPSAVASASPQPVTQAAPAVQAAPTASQLLAKTNTCKQISVGKYAKDEGGSKTVAVCDANGAVFWKADMDVDCDGVRTSRCNENTDCCYQNDTAFHASNGKPLTADVTHYIVVPSTSSIWRYTSSSLKGASSCAVIFNNKVLYAVIGDTGPTGIIGEASYATARDLGINPDPSNGGTDGTVTYICFKSSKVSPIESNSAATSVGSAKATTFVANN